MPRIVIVGGGISGLTLAHRLEQLLPEADVLILEKGSQPGGTIRTIEKAGFRVELGPNGFLDNNPSTLNLCRELDLESKLIPASEAARKNRFLLLHGRLRKLPTGLFSFLTTGALSWKSKWAILTERYRKPRQETSEESIDSFARRRLNDQIADTLVDAFVTGIHAGDPKLLSVQAALPRLAQFEKEHGSILGGMTKSAKQKRADALARGEQPRRGMRTWSFPGGLSVLVDAICDKLRQKPVTGITPTSVAKDAVTGLWKVFANDGQQWDADVLVLTCPGYAQAKLLAEVDADLSGKIDEIAYNRIAVVALGYRKVDVPHPLDGFGYLSPGGQKREVLGAQWCSTIFPERAPEGHVLIRAMLGGWHRADVVDWDDARLSGAVKEEMRTVLGIERDPVFEHVGRWDRAIPQYHLGHLDRVAWIEQRCDSHPGLFLGGNCYRGIALNDCVEQGGRLAETIAESITG